MRGILLARKKGVSEIISYTLLIVIAIAASVIVFNYLKLVVPKDKPSCAEGISLSISDYSCIYTPGSTNFTISLYNNGRFTVDAAYIRVGRTDAKTKTLINSKTENQLYLYVNGSIGLPPNQEYPNINYTVTDDSVTGDSPFISPGEYILEVQPAMNDKKTSKLALCESIITQKINCLSPATTP